jgi:hypothetical protein
VVLTGPKTAPQVNAVRSWSREASFRLSPDPEDHGQERPPSVRLFPDPEETNQKLQFLIPNLGGWSPVPESTETLTIDTQWCSSTVSLSRLRGENVTT